MINYIAFDRSSYFSQKFYKLSYFYRMHSVYLSLIHIKDYVKCWKYPKNERIFELVIMNNEDDVSSFEE